MIREVLQALALRIYGDRPVFFSRTRLLAVALALVGSVGTNAQPAVPSETRHQVTANRVVTELRQTLHGNGRNTWRQLVSNATWRDRRGHRDYPPSSVTPEPRGFWCSIATDSRSGQRRDAVFYGLRTERPYDCRLEHVRYVLEAESGVQELYDAFAAAINKGFDNEFSSVDTSQLPHLGIGPHMPPDSGDPGSWVDLRYWMTGTQHIVLARSGTAVHVMSQSHILSEALRSEQHLPPGTDRYGVPLLQWEVVNALRPSDPETVNVILSNEGVVDQDLVERAALRVLRARAKAATEDSRAMLSLAAGLVVGRLRYQGESPASLRRERPGLAPIFALGVEMRVSPFDSDVWYGHDAFSEDVRRRRPGTRWGQLAFLSRLSGGWTDFPSGDQYRHVVTQGTEWLKQHPGSPLAVAVMSHVARAYETWWSLSLAPPDEELVSASEHTAGAADARLQAIKWHERILRDAPTSAEAVHAWRVLILIRVGVDTGERLFYAVYA